MMETLEQMLVRHEAERLLPYLDCCSKFWRACQCTEKGKLTIGVGRNIEDVGLTQAESRMLLNGDIARVKSELDQALPWWREHPQVVQDVLVNLGFNLGVLTPPGKAKLLTFTGTLGFIRSRRYADAASNLEKTLWHKQVKSRALEIETALRVAEKEA